MLAQELLASRERQWDDMRELLASYATVSPIRRIAVVGNAPLAPDAQRAAEIDSCDLVVRVNALALDEPGSEPAVGTACNVVVLSYDTRITRWVFQNYRRRLYLVPQLAYPLYHNHRRVPLFWPVDLGSLPIPNGVVKVRLTERLDPLCAPGRLTPTSGMTALFLAHEMFPDAEMIATGFSYLSGTSQSEWIYHSGGSSQVNARHDLALEGALLRSWIADGSARFLT